MGRRWHKILGPFHHLIGNKNTFFAPSTPWEKHQATEQKPREQQAECFTKEPSQAPLYILKAMTREEKIIYYTVRRFLCALRHIFAFNMWIASSRHEIRGRGPFSHSVYCLSITFGMIRQNLKWSIILWAQNQGTNCLDFDPGGEGWILRQSCKVVENEFVQWFRMH